MLPRLCLALLLFCLSLQAWAFTPVVLDSIDTRQSLGNGTFYLEDRTGRLTSMRSWHYRPSAFVPSRVAMSTKARTVRPGGCAPVRPTVSPNR